MNFYKATHPITGKTALRNSASRKYVAAVVTAGGLATFHGTVEAARKARNGKYANPDWAVVGAVELTASEFAAAKKASKQHFKFLVEGKKVTRTRDVNSSAIVGILVEVHEAYTHRTHIAADAPQSTKDRHPLGYYDYEHRARVVTQDLFLSATYNGLPEAEAKVAGTYVKRYESECFNAVGECGLVKRYIARPL